jgi:serine/threonine protein kinase
MLKYVKVKSFTGYTPNTLDNNLLKIKIFGKYQIMKIISKSSFSTVYLGKCLKEKKKYVAIKVQKQNCIISELEREAYFQYYLRSIGIPKVLSFGKTKKYNILVETLLGKTINKLFEINNNPESKMKDMCMAAIQIIDRIEFVHSKNIIHQDIKPENFLVGNPDTSLIYIIDFGLCKKYRSSRTGKHIIFSKCKKFIGTLEYSSINSMKGLEMTRRDDMESIGYMLIHLIKGTLPWIIPEKIPFPEKYEKVYKIKANISNEELCKDLPIEMCKYMEYVKSLKYEEDPDYEYLRQLFFSILRKMNEKFDLNFSWSKEIPVKKGYFSQMKSFRSLNKSPFSKLLNLKENSMFSSLNKKSVLCEDSTEVSEKRLSFMDTSLSKIKNKYLLNKKEHDNKIIDDKIEEETYTSYKD